MLAPHDRSGCKGEPQDARQILCDSIIKGLDEMEALLMEVARNSRWLASLRIPDATVAPRPDNCPTTLRLTPGMSSV